jgi:hypothetical protein
MYDALGYYKILNVAPSADATTIKLAYRDLAKIWHPDYNPNQDTTEMFQKLSVAYDILTHPKSRLIYDTLSLVYDEQSYPDTDSLTVFEDNGEGCRVQAVRIEIIKAWLLGYKTSRIFKALTYKDALCQQAWAAVCNWLLGWWHPKALGRNFINLKHNFCMPTDCQETQRIWIHNMVAFFLQGRMFEAAKCGVQARRQATGEAKAKIEEFLQHLEVRIPNVAEWKVWPLRLIQLIVPGVVSLLLLGYLFFNTQVLSESELWSWFSKSKTIDYYQKVKFDNRGQSVDDVVVGKILSIPVDKSDSSKLYHLTKECRVMYGPSDEFDVIKTLAKQTTVRLTGMSPDNVWARIMLDNGESGFVYLSDIEQGIGAEIPFGSAITE